MSSDQLEITKRTIKTKSMSQARKKPEIFVNFKARTRPEKSSRTYNAGAECIGDDCWASSKYNKRCRIIRYYGYCKYFGHFDRLLQNLSHTDFKISFSVTVESPKIIAFKFLWTSKTLLSSWRKIYAVRYELTLQNFKSICWKLDLLRLA